MGSGSVEGMGDNPLEMTDRRERRLRERAYHLWEADGRPFGRDAEFWERARALDAIETSGEAGQRSATIVEHVDEAALEANLGEFPDRLSDQGEHLTVPMTKPQARASRSVG